MIETADASKQGNESDEIVEKSRKPPDEKLAAAKPPKWQERLLPVMIGLLIGLTLFFFVSTFLQISYLHRSILQMPAIDIAPVSGETLIASADTFENRLEARQLEVRSKMEAFIVTQRYRQANVVLMANLWIRYLGFITGMILALVGASFVLGKLREPMQKLEGKFSAIDISLRTASPGIILVVLGALLMFTTLVDEDFYKVTDGNIYLAPMVVPVTPEMPSLDTGVLPPWIFETPTPEPDILLPSEVP